MSERERESRRARLERLRARGVDPFPAGVGPRGFYEKAVGVIGERTFAVMTKDSPFKRATIPPL